ncbi:FecCD family ABC transporter permease [Paenibacillus sp. GXUN7292]|uniref:FecCD family ABC transporter permease n=1 Tax=Paenibacillus sp. GXUN7292 TaxID=3422499 RepID=UPI003D7CA80C
MAVRNHTSNQIKPIVIIAILGTLLLLLAVISMNVGKMNLSPSEVIQVLIGKGTPKQNLTVFDFRLPRITLAILVGIGMSLSGAILQSLLKNDLASPGTLGISSGSGLSVMLYITLFAVNGAFSPFILPLLAFAGGIAAAVIIFLLAYRKGREISHTGLILTGVAVGTGYGAITLLMTLQLDKKQYDFALRWSAGSLWGDNWNYISILAPWIIVIGFYVFYKSRALNTLSLGNQTAAGLGLAIRKEFIGLTLAAVALSSGSVALGGNFFFVGMISPHIARRLVGSNHKFMLPVAGLVGALIILLADTITRTISLGAGIPTGVIITILVTPYFLYLLAKAN